MTIQFSLREHKSSATHDPTFTFSKQTGTILRQTTTNPSLGSGYIFVVCDRAWIQGKYIRWRWGCDGSVMYQVATVEIYDGEYDRTSDVDFPSGSGRLIKGNGLLQTLRTQWAYGFDDIEDELVNVSGGVEDLCTIFFRLSDSWTVENFWLNLDWVQFNTGAGGIGTLFDEQFTDVITMERTGGLGDYGYISTGQLPPNGSVDLASSFDVGVGSKDLPAKFDSGQNSVELGAGFTVRQAGSQDLAASFDGQAIQNLPVELTVRDSNLQELAASFAIRRTATPLELKMGFWVRWYSVNLLANIYIRPMTGSKATDFEVKDNTRGLTVHDAGRVMTVTPRRKMRVK